MKNAGRRPWLAWLQQHCQGHEGCSCPTHTHTHTDTHLSIFCPIRGPPSPPSHLSALAKSWLAHNCTQECVCVCVCVCVPEGHTPLPLHQPVVPVVALADMVHVRTRSVSLFVLMRTRATHVPSLGFKFSVISQFVSYLWFPGAELV